MITCVVIIVRAKIHYHPSLNRKSLIDQKQKRFEFCQQSVRLTSIKYTCHSDNLYYPSATSILVLLRIIALLSSGCKATVESLPNVQSSSTTKQ